ncbi:lytic transglycosylase domain-containing protein [Falsirhodobacter algicola]|uniref:Transglycosylase SLT domain-containing protein n=1 Tax=Falsirhodobacter algicola TaxID=2692330 RepID=A0A8J8SKZ2_9RHOB|nr:lytic transglycosylase domain-containing protein [Falsirhodobacter algicola]QUS35923.1 transglycosylase SLT domain-containing protein [Falsirhodobacter algicola]
MMRIFLALAVILAPAAACAMQDPAVLCENAAADAARRVGVPVDVMMALTLAETGRQSGGRLRPWPWAINRGGEGAWFASQAEAMAFAETSLREGRRNFDIGCFQINHRWHADGFPNLAAMFDPETNALYAARFLRQHYDRTGDWAQAAGAYHSLTPEFADRYMQRFAALRRGEGSAPVMPAVARLNAFPLLNGGRGHAGSLVPLGSAARRLIGD